MTREELYNWLYHQNNLHILKECTDEDTGEVSATALAEEAAERLGHPEWLDDETHFVWEVAAEIADELDPNDAEKDWAFGDEEMWDE